MRYRFIKLSDGRMVESIFKSFKYWRNNVFYIQVIRLHIFYIEVAMLLFVC
jgi:hypothetical protein